MIYRTLFILTLLSSGLNLKAQSSTIEFQPEFIQEGSEYLSEVISFKFSSESFSFVGMSCYYLGLQKNEVAYRIQSNGSWSDWRAYRLQHEFVSNDRIAMEADPILISYQAIQFKSKIKMDAPIKFRAFISQRKSDSQPFAFKSLNCAQPIYCDRTCWCSNCPIDPTPELTEPTHLIVHHSAGFTTSNNFAGVVEYYYDLHVNTNGWDDIGYNWLIDGNGVVYLGRPDGYQGAHFSCLNENTVGVCMIGDFTLELPSPEAQRALVDLLAFEATEHQIDVESDSYHVEGDFVLNNVAGHRDSSGSAHACSTTACPGDMFYPMLQTIKTEIAALACYNESVSVTDQNLRLQVNVSPNPFSDRLQIITNQDDAIFELLDINGHKYATLIRGHNIDLLNIPVGMYLLVHNGRLVEKLIKQ